MSKKPESPSVQPYHNLDPARAAAKLGPAVDTTRFAKAAAFCAKGRDDLAKRGYAPDGKKRLRRFSIWEITKYLIPVASAHLRRVLRANPDLPQGEGEAGAKWFTLEEVLTLRDHFASEGSAAKEYRPYRPEGLPAKICAVANFKGGSGKTTTCAHLAMAAALDGYKVLVIDMDSQASMTSILGGTVADEWQTVFPLIAKDYARALQAENRVLAAAGQSTLPFDESLSAALETTPIHLMAQHEGRVISDIALNSIVLDHMMRDRMVVDAGEIEELKTSIRTNGLRQPIEVLAIEGGRYGLISGWRRVTALQQMQQEDPEGHYSIKAFIRPPYEAGALYTAMVEENELRAQITPYERGRIVVMSARLGAFIDTEAAIETIFAAASKAKRSKIRSFALVHEELGDMLQFPTDLSERNGLRLAFALREGFAHKLRTALRGSARSGPTYEWALLEPIVSAAEAVERLPDDAHVNRGGRPRKQFDRPIGHSEALANGITMEGVYHEDGYSIRLRGRVVDAKMVELLMDQLRRLLGPMPVHKI